MSDGIDFPGYSAKPAVQSLPIRRFDAQRHAWVESDADADAASVARDALTVATFNTWFQGGEQPLRHAGLLRVLEASDADVILLQEVTLRLLEAIESCAWVQSSFRLARAPFRADAVPSHGVMLLARIPVQDATLHPIPTHMGRSLLVAQARINGARLALATVHLESMKPNADVRGQQLQRIFAILEGTGQAILAGDFNFCSSWPEENARIDRRYLDVWPAVAPGDPGYTQDTDRNRMLALAKRGQKRVRIDRILLRSDARRWRPESIRLLGTEPVDPAHAAVYPSDHFGLCARIQALAVDRG